MAEMRARLADVEKVGAQLKMSEIQLEDALKASHESTEALKQFNEEMAGDFELMKHMVQWAAALEAFQDAALGNSKDVAATTPALTEFLCQTLHIAEPDIAPHSAAIVAWHPMDKDLMKVHFATEASGFVPGQKLFAKSATDATRRMWKVVRSGVEECGNMHGLKRDSEATRSVAPLKTILGESFGLLVSGPPAVPDVLMQMAARTAGPLLERVWKKEQVSWAVLNTVEWLKNASANASQLVIIKFHENMELQPRKMYTDDPWRWQPFAWNDPEDAKSFQLPLKWRLGEPIGVVEIQCSTFTDISEQLLIFNHTIGYMLQEAVEVIEGLIPGHPPPLSSQGMVQIAFEERSKQIAPVLERQISQQLAYFDANAIFSELKSFEEKVIDESTLTLLQAILTLLGFKGINSWRHVQKALKVTRKIKERMIGLVYDNVEDRHGARWNAAARIMRNVDLRELDQRSAVPVQILIRWFEAVTMTHNIALAMKEENKPVEISPDADRIFDTIDVNKDSYIQAHELVAYMLHDYPSTIAHRLLRTLDTDADQRISRNEWHRGWADGMISDLLRQHQSERESDTQASRLANRRHAQRGGVMALTVATSVREYEAKTRNQEEKSATKRAQTEKGKTKASGYH
uniref:EF-hand domain-containing protein n=2 Tax=Haptolina brevifila TaxID=156173 RepID=A0A7S2MUS6_9EUKA